MAGGIRNLRYAWVVVGIGFISLLLVQGAIYAFAVLLPPLEAEFGWSRAQTSSIFSIFLLTNAICLPIFGRSIDVWDPRLVLGSGAILAGGGFVLIQFVDSLWQLYLLYVVIGIGGTAISIGTISPVVAKRFDARRGLAVGVTTTGFSVGRLVLIPLAGLGVAFLGWRPTTLLLGLAIFVLVAPVGLFVRSHEATHSERAHAREDDEFATGSERNIQSELTVRSALRTRNFALLLTGYMICGFTVMLFAAHFVAFAIDRGLTSTVASTALGIEGGATIIGLLAIGTLSDRIGRRLPLAGTYFVRGFIFIAFLLVESPFALVALAFLFGIVDLASIPMVTSLTHELFGAKNSGTLYALLTSGHQIAGAGGVFVAGVLYDGTGTYRTVFVVSFVLLLIATTASLLLTEGRPPHVEGQPPEVSVPTDQQLQA